MKIVCLICFWVTQSILFGQETLPISSEQALESEAENSDIQTEDDFAWQQLAFYQKHPLDLNQVSGEIVASVFNLSPILVSNFIRYRKLLGPLVDIHELQAVPGWDSETIQFILPYVTIQNSGENLSLLSRFRLGEHVILSRISVVLQKAKGFQGDSAKYAGSPLKILLRYKYQFRNLLQFGLTAEKDAGESLFGPGQRPGFDFYSFHCFFRDMGKIRAVAIGDYHLNLGQGLIHWQGVAFRKGAEVTNAKRQSAPLRPYNSTDENRFHRGAAVTLGMKKIDFTFFAAFDQLDANKSPDTIAGLEYVSSFQTSGFHRTQNERDDKNELKQTVTGARMLWSQDVFRLGVNAINYWFSLPIKKSAEPYNLYAISGKRWNNYSVDYALTYKNLHFFGEIATDRNLAFAFIHGILTSLHPKIDLAVAYRAISARFRSISGNAFTASSEPNNERGLYIGAFIRPSSTLSLQAYADHYQFPWLKYRVDNIGRGAGYQFQILWRPDRNLEIIGRFREDRKSANSGSGSTILTEVREICTRSVRTQINLKVNRAITLKSRVDFLWYFEDGKIEEHGFSGFTDIFVRSGQFPLAFNARVHWFETGGYNSRVYAYENDVLYHSAIPALFDAGARYYINIHYNITKKLQVWAKWAHSIYRDMKSIGTGLDEVPGNHKSEARLQFMMVL